MKRILTLSMVMAVVLVVAGCGKAAPTAAPEAGARTIRIGMVNFGMVHK